MTDRQRPMPRERRSAGLSDLSVGRRLLALLLLAALGAGLPLIVIGVCRVESNTTDMKQWLPDGRDEVTRYEEFVRLFGVDDFVLLTWDGCTLEDPRLERLASQLRQAMAKQSPPLWRQVTSGVEMLRRLTDDPPNLDPQLAGARMQGLLLGREQTSALLLALTDAGRDQPHQVIDQLRQIAEQSCQLQAEQLRIAGSVYKVAMIDQESERSFRLTAAPSCLLALLVTWFLLRNWRLTLMVLASATYCGGLSVALVQYFHGGLNAVLIVLPTLIYVLTVSGAVHLANYYQDAVREAGTAGAAARALRAGWLPCTLATVSTAIGMASLCRSDLAPVRNFGLFSAISLVLSLPILLSFCYALLSLWPGRQPPAVIAAGQPDRSMLDAISGIIIRHHWPLLAICLMLLSFSAWGLRRTTASVDLFRSFRPTHPLIGNYQWIEEHLGPVAAIEVVVRIPNQCDWPLLDRLERLNEACYRIYEMPDVGPAMSVMSLVPPIPESGGFRGVVDRRTYASRLRRQRQQLIDEGWLAETGDAELWRIHVRVPEFTQAGYSDTINALDAQVGPLFADGAGVTVTYTGGFPLISEAQAQLLNDLIQSFCWAFLLLCPIIMLVMRGVLAGLVAMIPNIVPVVAVFGVMGWLSIPIEIGTMLTASVALGIAVDDTLHFLTWYRRSLTMGVPRVEAIQVAFRRCAAAMMQTTLICSSGMLMLIPASFVPASNFALLMVVLLMMALIGDLVFLPALLASPLGGLFFHRRPAPQPTSLRSGEPNPVNMAAALPTNPATSENHGNPVDD